MTFFLPQAAPTESLPARGTDTPIPTFWQGLGAYTSSTMLERDANLRASREERDARLDVIGRAISVYGEDQALGILRETMPNLDIPAERIPEVIRRDERLQQTVLNALRADAEARPDAYAGLDLSDEGLTAQANAVLQGEYQDAQDMIALTDGGVTAPLVGGLVGGLADVRNAPFLVGGAGGAGRSFLSVVGREAALNVAAEAAFLPSQFEMAERLQIEDPGVLATLRDAALVGAAFGAAGEAVSRGLTYYRGTRARPTPLHPAETQLLVDKAEEALTSSPDPIGETVGAVQAAVTERRAAALAERPPLIVRQEARSAPPEAVTPSEAPIPPDAPPAAPTPAPEPWEPDPQAVALYESERARVLDENPGLRPTRSGERRTLSAWIKHRGGIEWTQPSPGGGRVRTWVAQELEARGVTQNQAVGLKRTGGSRDLDNLVGDADEIALFGRSGETDYLDREALVDALAREISTGKSEPTRLSMKQAMDDLARLERETFSPPRPPQERFLEGQSVPDGWVVRPGDYEGNPTRLGADLGAFLADRYPGARFSAVEMREMAETLAETGGDADLLVERILEREVEFFAAPAEAVHDPIPGWDDPPAQALPSRGGEGPGGPDQAAGAARGGAAGEGPDPRPAQRGASRVLTEAARAADEGAFDIGARADMDWLDAPAGPKAKPVQDQRTADLRRLVEEEDRPVTFLGVDGEARTMSLSAALDDLDAGDDFLDVLAACGIGRRTA